MFEINKKLQIHSYCIYVQLFIIKKRITVSPHNKDVLVVATAISY